jgi:diguanylate cyclase (GGDEF)-like protein
MSLIELLKRLEIFSTLLDDDLNFIITRLKEVTLTKDNILFTKDSAADHFYIIRTGEIMVTQVSRDGKDYTLAKYGTGDCFGEFGFITGTPHDVEAKASKFSKVLLFPGPPYTLESLSIEKPDFVSRLYLCFLTFISGRLRAVHNLISDNTEWVKHLQEQIYIDQLTGLYTKPFLESEIQRMLHRPAAIIMIKPDRFKELNDNFGHKAGDAILEKIGNDLGNIFKNKYEGWAIRLRSNELCVVCQKTDKEEALQIAEMIGKNILKIGPSWHNSEENKVYRLTSSICVGICRDRHFNNCFKTIYKKMQNVWKKGGNKICFQNLE